MSESNLNVIRDRIVGPVYSILTPFDPQTEEIDYEALEAYLQRIHDAGGTTFYVMAYNSRYSQLREQEIKGLNAFVAGRVKQLNEKHVVIVGDPPHCSTKVSIEFARHAEESGADIISLVVRERFFSEEQIFQHYRMVDDDSNIGILIHEMPFLNGYGGPSVTWPLSLLDRVADLPSVMAIKEDTKEDEHSKQVVDLLKDRLAIIISGGGKRQWMRFAEDGCQAWLNGIGVFEPRLATRFWEAWNNGDEAVWRRIIEEVEIPFFEGGVNKFGWHLAIKAAVEARGIMSRHDRMPLMPLSDEDAAEVARVISEMDLDGILDHE